MVTSKRDRRPKEYRGGTVNYNKPNENKKELSVPGHDHDQLITPLNLQFMALVIRDQSTGRDVRTL